MLTCRLGCSVQGLLQKLKLSQTLFSGVTMPAEEIRSRSDYFILAPPAHATYRSMSACATVFEFIPFPFSSVYKSLQLFSVWIRNRLSVLFVARQRLAPVLSPGLNFPDFRLFREKKKEPHWLHRR